jgi:hypothetical protein
MQQENRGVFNSQYKVHDASNQRVKNNEQQ